MLASYSLKHPPPPPLYTSQRDALSQTNLKPPPLLSGDPNRPATKEEIHNRAAYLAMVRRDQVKTFLAKTKWPVFALVFGFILWRTVSNYRHPKKPVVCSPTRTNEPEPDLEQKKAAWAADLARQLATQEHNNNNHK
eukprot:gnl/Spiro4/13737_TR7328_c0_g1_i1.p1 gnl/Spiro4/13737_TR7328_c0_g1~~gnl/Spiro4/13737_TR7328_c0_g1_i1.p1  ORF type:complete len:137 (+),score=24.30 gnl/Spiro4/13737_TR7328_c0_g1_i1:39-449(+)